MEGIIGIDPEIKKIVWPKPDTITIFLKDGRIVSIPTKWLPSVKKVKKQYRSKPKIVDGNMFTWPMCEEIYHIEQVLGKEEDYKYKG